MPIASGVAGSRSLLRRINSLALLRELRHGPATITRLVHSAGLSRTATEAVLTDLQDLGWVNAVAPEERGDRPAMGRPAASYTFAADAGRMLSIDIGAHHIHAILTDLLGTPLAGQNLSVRESAPADERLRAVRTVAGAVLGAAGVGAQELWAVALGSPGVISEGTVRHFGGSGMPGWIGQDLAAGFADDFACPILVEGDCALGTIAEHRLGAAQGVRDMVYVLCGNRTGAGIVVNGELFRGHRGGTGLIGELPQLRWRELETDYPGSPAAGGQSTRLEMFNAARGGDPAALASVSSFAEALSLGIAAMTLAVDPELVVLGGGSSHSADLYVDLVQEHLSRLCPLVPRLTVSALGADAVALGGIQIAWNHIDARLAHLVEQGDAFPQAGAAFMAR
ncbi:ROK family protein [Streptomyces sp. NPDC091292]|uniref:ROK family protein n=1 Tax=Streptomyces sp. NPDC091292 TaxID=3365991 RepID=UPI0038228587